MDRLKRFLQLPPVSFVAQMVDVYFAKRVGRAAAELTYFLVLTFFPILICISAFLDSLNLNTTMILEQAAAILPSGVTAVLREYLHYIDTHHSMAMLIVGLFLAMFFASAAVRSLMNIMQEIYDRTTFSGLWQLVASVLFSFLLLAAVYLSMVVIVSGNWFFRQIGAMLGLENLASHFVIWQWVKYVALLALVFVVVVLLYRFSAPLQKPRPLVLPGALLASVAMAVASWIFSILVSGSTQYSLVYGSLASVIILLVWVYLCGNILILGCVFNFILCQRRRPKSAEPAAPSLSASASVSVSVPAPGLTPGLISVPTSISTSVPDATTETAAPASETAGADLLPSVPAADPGPEQLPAEAGIKARKAEGGTS